MAWLKIAATASARAFDEMPIGGEADGANRHVVGVPGDDERPGLVAHDGADGDEHRAVRRPHLGATAGKQALVEQDDPRRIAQVIDPHQALRDRLGQARAQTWTMWPVAAVGGTGGTGVGGRAAAGGNALSLARTLSDCLVQPDR